MSKKIVMDWSQPKTIDNVIFPADKLKRSTYAEFLSKFLASQGYDEMREGEEKKRNYVLNLNSEWGSGKTYFLKRWAEDLKEHYPVVYVDAWEKDYSEDPLMTVVSAIIQDLKTQSNLPETEFSIPSKAIGLLKAAAPGIARGLAKRFLGIDPLAIMQGSEDSNNDLQPVMVKDEEGEEIDISFAASDAVKYLIDEHEAKGEAIKSLKKHVSQWVEIAKNAQLLNFPAFVFIDELDRCRPSYAVEMLETIKHIFDIPGVVFIVATDTGQLQHAVKAIYGEGFDAQVYLGRFFNSRFSLKAPSLVDFLDAHSDSYKLDQKFLEGKGIQIFPENIKARETLRNISTILDIFQLSARTSIQIADRIIATVSNMPKDSCVDIIMLTLLHCIKEKDNDVYQGIISGKSPRLWSQGKSAANLNATLTEFMLLYVVVNPEIINFTMEFIPTKHINTARQLNLQPRDSQFIQGTHAYNFSLSQYIETIFSPLLDSRSVNGGLLELSDSVILERLLQYKNLPVISVYWISYLYKKEMYYSIDRDEYADLIELASAFDWMGKEELVGD